MRILKYAVILLLVSPAFAQPGPGMGFGKESGRMRRQVQEKIKTIKIWRLTEAIGLTPEQSEKFFPVYNKHQELMEKFESEKREMLRQIQGLTGDSNSSDEDINAAINQFKQHNRQFADLQATFISDISEFLSVRQRGKLLVFEEEFRKNMQRIIGEIRREFRGGPENRRRQ